MAAERRAMITSSAASTGIIPRKTITVPRDYPRQAHEDAPRPCSVRGPSEDRREHRKDSSLVMRSFSQNRQARTADGQCQEPGGARVRVSKGATEKPNIDPEFEEVAEGEELEEVGYLLEGTLLLEVEGRSPVTLKAGDLFPIKAGRPHNVTNMGTTTAKVLSTYIVGGLDGDCRGDRV
jgi:cupin domain